MKAIIFGASGQDGFYLTKLLGQHKVEVIGVSRSEGPWVRGNVADFEFVSSLIAFHKPNFIFHLAAKSVTAHDTIFENHEAISTGTLNILESVLRFVPSSKVFIAGSALQFVNLGSPINEETPFEARSPYAVARIQSAYAARYFRNCKGLNVYLGYLFNHDSPLRAEKHVNQKIVKAALRIAEGGNEQLVLGDIEVRKEFNFAGDIVDAIWVLINQSEIYELVIGCGEDHSIAEWVHACFSIVGADWRPYLKLNEDRFKEYDRLVSDPKKLFHLGWKPSHNLGSLAQMMMAVKG